VREKVAANVRGYTGSQWPMGMDTRVARPGSRTRRVSTSTSTPVHYVLAQTVKERVAGRRGEGGDCVRLRWYTRSTSGLEWPGQGGGYSESVRVLWWATIKHPGGDR